MSEQGTGGGRELLSAGGVVVQRGRQGVRVLVLYDSRHDEWRLPKGKLKPGETASEAAEREVAEETGLALSAGTYLGATTYAYPDPHDEAPTHKIVYFFAMSADAEAQARPEEGTSDSVEWLAPRDAAERLTWPNEAVMVMRGVEAG